MIEIYIVAIVAVFLFAVWRLAKDLQEAFDEWSKRGKNEEN